MHTYLGLPPTVGIKTQNVQSTSWMGKCTIDCQIVLLIIDAKRPRVNKCQKRQGMAHILRKNAKIRRANIMLSQNPTLVQARSKITDLTHSPKI